MKKIFCIVLTALALGAACPLALAASLPAKAAKVIQEAGWEGYKAATVYGKGSVPAGMLYALMRKGDQNLFCALKYSKENDEYLLLAANENLLPPGRITPKLTYYDSPGEFYIEYSIKKPGLGQPSKVCLQFFSGGIYLQSAELTYPGGSSGFSTQDYLTTNGGKLYLTRGEVDRRGDFETTEETVDMFREGWVYNLPSFSLEQVMADIAYIRSNEGGPPPPLLAQVPLEWAAGMEAGELIQYGDRFASIDAESVSFGSQGISDIAALTALTAPESLGLGNNQITDLQPLAGLTSLRELSLSNNRIEDLGPLAKLTSLTELSLNGNAITELQPLSGLGELESLSLSNNQITDLGPLSSLIKLNYLALDGNPLTDLSPLYELTGLATLRLGPGTDAGQAEELKRRLDACNIIEIAKPDKPAEKPKTFMRHGWKYSLSEEGGAVLTGYRFEPRGKLVIPGELDGQPVTHIGSGLFVGSELTSVTIQSGVTAIESNAFAECYDLKSVTLPAGLTSIGAGAFKSCESLTGVKIPDSVTHIGDRAFLFCVRLRSLTLPKGLVSIGDRAFSGTMKSIFIPENVTEMSGNPFERCYDLTKFDVSDQNSVFASVGGVLVNKRQQTLVAVPGRMPGGNVYIIPQGVLSIGDNAFSFCDRLKSLTIPNSVTSIGQYAFSWCERLTSLDIPDSVTSIGGNAFYECSGLTLIVAPGSFAEQYAKEKNIPYELTAE